MLVFVLFYVLALSTPLQTLYCTVMLSYHTTVRIVMRQAGRSIYMTLHKYFGIFCMMLLIYTTILQTIYTLFCASLRQAVHYITLMWHGFRCLCRNRYIWNGYGLDRVFLLSTLVQRSARFLRLVNSKSVNTVYTTTTCREYNTWLWYIILKRAKPAKPSSRGKR